MQVTSIRAYSVPLPLREGRYRWASGRSVEVFDSTLVRVECDDGSVGWGEVCPLGPVYLPAHARGARAGIEEIAPHLVGLDPTNLGEWNAAMDAALAGHPHAKSALDVAAHDLLGRAVGRPLVDLLGGRRGEDFVLYRAISQDAPEAMAARVRGYREEGYRRFQLKVGGEVEADIERIRAVRAVLEPGDVLVADANTGWTTDAALRVVRAVRDLDVYVEQPCATLEGCLVVRRASDLPMVLDECITDVPSFLRAHRSGAMDAINIKISKLGGLTRARVLRDLCIALHMPMTIEDSWGGDLVTAAIAHLAHSTPPELLFTSTDFNDYVTTRIAEGAPRRRGGRLAAPGTPGLGAVPLAEVLGEPVVDVRAPR